ncbi:MAG: hypothetical protein ACRDGV_12760 [Candidatus Limnocylindria bacterium]
MAGLRILNARLFLSLLLAMSALLLPVERVTACSCAMSTPEEEAARSDAVFSGTVVATEQVPNVGVPAGSDEPTTIYTFAVDGVVRGTVGSQHPVLAGGDGASCGMSFGMDERWLVFAIYDGPMLTTGLCNGNLPLPADEEPPLPISTPVESAPEPEGLNVPLPVVLSLGAVALLAIVSLWVFRRAER